MCKNRIDTTFSLFYEHLIKVIGKTVISFELDIKGFERPDIKTVATIIFSQLNDEDTARVSTLISKPLQTLCKMCGWRVAHYVLQKNHEFDIVLKTRDKSSMVSFVSIPHQMICKIVQKHEQLRLTPELVSFWNKNCIATFLQDLCPD